MQYPFVSIIIPVLNVSSTIRDVLDALIRQSYPQDRYEVIIVDNGSTDDTEAIVKAYPVTLLKEHSIKSPYAARNKGLKCASGTVIGLTDGNKIPKDDWIEQGVKGMQQRELDLVGGKVEFLFSKKKTLGEIFDSITFLDNEKYVREEKASLGGNMFFHKRVMEAIGNFRGDQRSGMDIYWSRKATNAGFRLGYDPEVVVYSVARSATSTLGKSFRVGIGHPLNMRNSGRGYGYIIYHILRTFLPSSPSKLYNRIIERGESGYVYYFIPLWFIDYGKKLAMGAGRIVGLFRLYKE